MSPAAKFNTLLASVVVLVMFILIARLAPLLQSVSLSYQLAIPFVGLLTSAGLYRLLALGARWVMERSTYVNRKVLGPNYVHGTWIGWFLGRNGDKRLTIEHYVQDLDDLVITGRSFTDLLAEHAYWESEAATIDARKGRGGPNHRDSRISGISALL